MKVLCIIPAYNEAANLSWVLEGLAKASARLRPVQLSFCVIDDGSTDSTSQAALAHGAMVIRHEKNLGIGAAVRSGLRLACTEGSDAAIQIDGDGQHDPQDIAALLAPIAAEQVDLVVGSRFLSDGGYRATAFRRMGIAYLAWLLRARSGVRFTDPTSGYRAMSRQMLELFAEVYPHDYPEPPMLALALKRGFHVREIAVRMHARRSGVSSIGTLGTLAYAFRASVGVLSPAGRAIAVSAAPQAQLVS